MLATLPTFINDHYYKSMDIRGLGEKLKCFIDTGANQTALKHISSIAYQKTKSSIFATGDLQATICPDPL